MTGIVKSESDKKIIYTHDEAARIIDMFEEILAKHNIHIPSPEDDERDPENMVGLYGSTYSDLLDEVEFSIIDIADRASKGGVVVKYTFSGKY